MVSNTFVKGFVMGALFAGAAALLTASRSGRENRKMIADKGTEFRDKALSTIAAKRGQLGEIVSNVAGKSQEQVDRLKEVGRNVSLKEKKILQQGAQDLKEVVAS